MHVKYIIEIYKGVYLYCIVLQLHIDYIIREISFVAGAMAVEGTANIFLDKIKNSEILVVLLLL